MKLADIEKVAVEIAELAAREGQLAAEATRIADELAEVRLAKAQKLQRLASGSNGAPPVNALASRPKLASALAPTPEAKKRDTKERVYEYVTSDPSRIMTAADVCGELGVNRGTASVYLSELAKETRIRRIPGAQGKYQALAAAMPAKPNNEDTALPGRILRLFAAEHGRTFDAPAVGERFGLTSDSAINSIRGALSRLNRQGRIEKVGHGEYKHHGGGAAPSE